MPRFFAIDMCQYNKNGDILLLDIKYGMFHMVHISKSIWPTIVGCMKGRLEQPT
jgi:hypothetical protein